MKFRILSALCFLLVFPALASAQWAATGTTVSAVQNDQRAITMCSDGAGGAIIVWVEGLNTGDNSDKHIKAQRISPAGEFLWGTDGIWISQAAGGQMDPSITLDGSGGAVVTWVDYRNGYGAIYVQRISAAGQLQWQTGGVPAAVGGKAGAASIAADGNGGAFVTWLDSRRPYWDIYAQHLDATGRAVWPAEGLLLSTQQVGVAGPNVVPDGAGGAIFAWHDFRNFPLSPSGVTILDRSDIYAVRMNSTGQHLWGVGGLPVVTGLSAAPKKWTPGSGPDQLSMIADGAGGVIVVWHDARAPACST